jgi:hypothetical protein
MDHVMKGYCTKFSLSYFLGEYKLGAVRYVVPANMDNDDVP